MTVDQPHELTWGALVLSSDVAPDTPYRFETLVGTTLGNPVTLVEAVRSYIEDGDLSVRTGWGNREDVPVIVRVSAPDGQALAQGEAALATEFMADRPNPLIWTPPSAGAWPLALEVVTVAAERDWPVEPGSSWDHRERANATRVYRLEFNFRPFSRDLETTVIPALPVPEEPEGEPIEIVVNACDSTSGWELRSTAGLWYGREGPTLFGGSVQVSGFLRAGSGLGFIAAAVTQSVSLTSTPYLVVDVETSVSGAGPTSGPGAPAVSVRYDVGTPQDRIEYPTAIAPTDDPAIDRYYFEAPASYNNLEVRLRIPRTTVDRKCLLRVHNISRTDRLGIDGTAGFQIARIANIEGTAPTAAAVRLDAGEAPLIGSIAMVYTGKSPVVPLRKLVAESAPALADPDKISGAYNDLSDPMVFLVPVNQLTDSTYTLLALLSFTGTATIDWSARLVDENGANIPGSEHVVSGTILLRNDTADPRRIHAIAAPHLPVIAVEGETSDKVELTLSMPTGGAAVSVDECWLTDTDNGAVTLVHEPSTFQLTAIELRSAQLGAPRPSVYGTWSGGRVQDITRLARIGTHRFEPGQIHIFTATDLAKYAPCELEYYRRYFLHPGPALPGDSTEG